MIQHEKCPQSSFRFQLIICISCNTHKSWTLVHTHSRLQWPCKCSAFSPPCHAPHHLVRVHRLFSAHQAPRLPWSHFDRRNNSQNTERWCSKISQFDQNVRFQSPILTWLLSSILEKSAFLSRFTASGLVLVLNMQIPIISSLCLNCFAVSDSPSDAKRTKNDKISNKCKNFIFPSSSYEEDWMENNVRVELINSEIWNVWEISNFQTMRDFLSDIQTTFSNLLNLLIFLLSIFRCCEFKT